MFNCTLCYIENDRDEYLMLHRVKKKNDVNQDKWIGVGGKFEDKESPEECLLREVQEETGIDQLQLKDLICITDHCYRRDGIWHLKHTWWYDMLYTDPTDLTPQREEDITKASWVAKSSLPPFLRNTYPSILEVFREAKV